MPNPTEPPEPTTPEATTAPGSAASGPTAGTSATRKPAKPPASTEETEIKQPSREPAAPDTAESAESAGSAEVTEVPEAAEVAGPDQAAPEPAEAQAAPEAAPAPAPGAAPRKSRAAARTADAPRPRRSDPEHLTQVDLRGRARAIDRAQAVIEFALDGTVLAANENFLQLMGYSLDEVAGRHHSMFVADSYAESKEYRDFWDRLRAGEYESGEYKRLARGGREVWIRATYNPILDDDGTPIKVVKFAYDVTATKRTLVELEGRVAAVERSQASIEFDLDGTILAANQNFLDLMGYAEEQIRGKHHRIFVGEDEGRSPAYRAFWQRLASGSYESGEFKRIANGGREVWIQATYNPILDPSGKAVKVVKYAMDITEAKRRAAEFEGRAKAVDRAQAVIEFDLNGKILTANDNFLAVFGYSLDELRGHHHRMLCEPEYTKTTAYAELWRDLAAGKFAAGEFKRIAKDGHEVWIQATYNPILDADGNPYKVVKFATDITAAKLRNVEFEGMINAIGRSQAVVEFNTDGTVITANVNFRSLMGYRLEDIQGRHHAMFCDPEYAKSDSYKQFWASLANGEYQAGEFRRITRNGKEVWLQATYNPIMDPDGRVLKIVKFASDITADKLRNAEFEGKVAAMDRAQAVVEFDLEGHVTDANDNFLRLMGFSLRELTGQHHSMLCPDDYVVSEEYRDFWVRLRRGEFLGGRFHRIGKYGRNVWIQATYNPIFDMHGKPVKVVKFAMDITPQVLMEQRVAEKTGEMTITVTDLAGLIEEVSESAGSALTLANSTQQDAESGFQALGHSLEAIGQMQRSSGEIAEIVAVIGEIANQTNLLAFNASIEAARAGEHGVGFSVVAGEVRKLAERSSEAARSISRLITESQNQIAQGVSVSQQAKDAFAGIVSSVGRTGEAMEEIATNTRRQRETSTVVKSLIVELASDHGMTDSAVVRPTDSLPRQVRGSDQAASQ